ncbi:retrovirus-related pol polyprotein from transposon TNT 1-94 [Tanacetum coccineum]
MHMLTKPQFFYDDTHKQALGYQNPFHLKKAKRIQPTLYDGSVIAKEHAVIFVIDDEETLILEEESRSKMLDKQNDPIYIEKKIKISPIHYLKLNKIKEDFGKCFVTQKELFAKQAFWFSSLFATPVKSYTPVRVEAPSKLPKDAVDQCSIDKNVFEIQIKQLRIDNDQLLNQIMSQEIVHIVANSMDILDLKKSCVNDCSQCPELETELLKKKDFIEKEAYDKLDLNAQLQEKVFAITALKNELRKLKGKNIVDTTVSKPNATIALGMFKLDMEPISHRLKNNRDVHEVYIEKTIENTYTLHGFIERARTQIPSEPLLVSACMFTKHVQELLVYVSQTCPNSPKPSEKLVFVTPMNKDKRVRFAEPVTSPSNIPKQTDSLKTTDFNKPLLTSTGVKPTTSASRSKPSGNTKTNRIMRPPSGNQKNKVKDHSRKVNSSLNKSNSISEPINNALVKHSMRHAKFESICAIYNKCSRDTNLYIISLYDMLNTSPICLLSKASKTKSWLWHRRLSHLNFGILNKLAKDGLARGIPKLKFQKDHLCSACTLGKSKKSSHQPKAEDTNQEELFLLWPDACGEH